MNHPDTLLLGGGYTIQRVAALLQPERVLITSRSEERCRAFQAQGYHACTVDIQKQDSIKKLFDSYPRIQVLVDSIPPQFQAAPHADAVHSAVAGLRSLCSMLPASIKRAIYLSTSGVYGVTDGSIVTEDRIPDPVQPRGHARLQSELLYKESAVPSTALRIVAIYGPGRGLGLALKNQRYSLIDQGRSWTNRIHVDDLAAMIAGLIQYPLKKTLPSALNACDDEPARASDVVQFYCEKFSLPQPKSISQEEARAQGSWTRLSNQRVQNAKIKEFLELELKYSSYREGAGTEFENSLD